MTAAGSGLPRAVFPVAAATLSLAAALAFAAPAAGATVEELERRIEALTDELARVKGQLDALAKAGREAPVPSAGAGDGSGVEVTTKGGIKVKTTDGNFEAQVGGRILADYAAYDEDKSALGDGTELRSGRLFLQGKMFRDFAFKNEIDFADDRVTVKDAYLRYAGFAPTTATLGSFKPRTSLENMTGRRFLTFMERGLPNVFVPSQTLGLGIDTHGEGWSAAAGLFGMEVGEDVSGEGDEGWQATGRVTVAPLNEKRRVVHAGGHIRYHDPADGDIRLRARPESHVTDARFVDTGTLTDVAEEVSYGAEAAAVWGPFSLQGEYLGSHMDRRALGAEDPWFDGWYAYASLFLTGESRTYDPAEGRFERVTPKRSLFDGGWGAVEIAGRVSRLDLSDEGVAGGEERNVTLGLNWYPHSHVRFMANHVWVDSDHDATGNAANAFGGVTDAGDDDPEIFQFRGQVDF